MSALNQAIEKIKKSGSIQLEDLKSLKIDELESFADEVQHWCVYGNSLPDNLGKFLNVDPKTSGGGNLESN